ncbi:MAG TPA: threonine synthase [Firmicutes bacterium]|nr:threonine synthase [Bacillota bacterium]
MAWQGIIRAYWEFLPVDDKTPVVTLLEGNTPLIEVPRFAKAIGSEIQLFVKYEGLNPTGSFKDRGMTLAVSKAVEAGSKAVMCASTGNTSASAAAYAARAGLRCIVLLPEGAIALGKLAQALVQGAEVIAVKGNFDDALRLVRVLTEQYPITLVNSLNPYRLEGQKTAAFEIVDVLGDAPDYLAIPVGNAGNISAYWQGFKEYKAKKLSSRLPRLLGFQAAGAAPIVENRVIEKPETIATAIRIGNPASWQKAVAARDESGGLIDKVTDEEILAAYQLLAATEGIFCEPASAASLAGVTKLASAGYFPRGAKVVAVLTGHGLKDPDRAVRISREPLVLEPNLDVIAEAVLSPTRR